MHRIPLICTVCIISFYLILYNGQIVLLASLRPLNICSQNTNPLKIRSISSSFKCQFPFLSFFLWFLPKVFFFLNICILKIHSDIFFYTQIVIKVFFDKSNNILKFCSLFLSISVHVEHTYIHIY